MKSYKEIAEALKGKQHKLDKNKNGKLDAHDFKLLRKEETELVEATVKTQKYSWGTMKTVHHGSDFSIPLHPEHHQEIAKLKDEQEHKFKDETGRHWTARRKGEDVHFHSGNDGPKTVVKHSALKEQTIDEKKVPEATGDLKDACWKGYTAVGMKTKNGKQVPNCVPVKEEKDEEDRVTRSDYKVSPSGRKTHKEIVFKHGEDKKEGLDEVAPPGFEGTVKAMKKKKEIDNPYALAWSMYKKGYKSHKNADGTMKEETKKKEEPPFEGGKEVKTSTVKDKSGAVHTPMSRARHLARQAMNKQVKEEIEEQAPIHAGMVNKEVENIEERNKQNATMRKMMDASRGARFKAQGNYVPDPEPEHKTAQAHNKAIGRAIRKMSNEEIEQISEGIKTTHEDPLVTVHDKDGLHTHANLSVANHIFQTNVKHTDVHKGAVKTKSGGSYGNVTFALSKHHAQAVKDEEKFRKQFGEQAPVAPVPGDKWKSHAVMVHKASKQRVVIDRKNTKNYPESEGWKEVSPGMKLKEDKDLKLSYKEMMMFIEGKAQYMVKLHHGDKGHTMVKTYTAEKGEDEYDVKRRAHVDHGRSGYSVSSVRKKDTETYEADDENETSSTQKRGRGRPAGSKSGARGPRIK